MATDRTAEIKGYWECGDFSPEELEQRVKMSVNSMDYQWASKRREPDGKGWLIERVVRAYQDIKYLLAQMEKMRKNMCWYCWLSSQRDGADMHSCDGCEWKGAKNNE